MENKKALFTSNSQNWATPDYLKRFIELEFGEYYDPCPLNNNPTFDGLTVDWKDVNYVNPPYNNISAWVDKAIEENKKNKEVIMLIPARTDTKYFEKLLYHGCGFIFITGRLSFNDSKYNAPFPSVLIELKGTGMNHMYHIHRDKMKETGEVK